MKKILILLLTIAMLFTLVACGEKEPAKQGDDGEKAPVAEQEAGTTYNVGEFSVYIPGGWKEFPMIDPFSEEGAIDGTSLQIVKGGVTEFDFYSKPYVQLKYYGEDIEMYQDKSFYDDVVDLDPVVAGEHTWEAFSCSSLGYKMTILWLVEGVHEYQAVVYTDMEDGTVSVTDADVLEILASVVPN